MILLVCCSVATMSLTTSCKDDDEDKEATEVVKNDEEEDDSEPTKLVVDGVVPDKEKEQPKEEEKTDGGETEEVETGGETEGGSGSEAGGEAEVEPESEANPVAENGALKKASYKVSATKSVYFSQGNLQYNAARNKWRFAAKQYDYVEDANSNISSTYDGWIDLFGWGTGNNPTNTSTDNSDYNTFTDWGVNAICNGGNVPNKWRTLTADEWKYLFQNNKWTLCCIGTRWCFMLIPTGFTAPDGITVTVLSTSTTSSYVGSLSLPYTNHYSEEEFKKLENLGVVALRRVTGRYGTEVLDSGRDGFYWSSSVRNSFYVYGFRFGDTYVRSYYEFRNHGEAVRLVQDL